MPSLNSLEKCAEFTRANCRFTRLYVTEPNAENVTTEIEKNHLINRLSCVDVLIYNFKPHIILIILL